MKAIAETFKVSEDKILNIQPLKVGMTNHSFTFTHEDIKYIMRIPGEGTDKMIDRELEFSVYQTISKLKISDDVVLIDPKNGYKITLYIEAARVCDPLHVPDVKACMGKLREFHSMKLHTEHTFDIFERIEYYESLWLQPDSCFRDYRETKGNVMKLKEYIDSAPKEWILTHIDAVPDNFLFEKVEGEERIRLIDWEYSGMQDPHVDIAMFAIYAMYNREQVETLIDCYFIEGCPDAVRTKIYAYIAMCGLLWSNWCEYKSHMGVEFGEYALSQYRFAKDYYRIFREKKQEESK
jgi:thiamine kinase-like enzyme